MSFGASRQCWQQAGIHSAGSCARGKRCCRAQLFGVGCVDEGPAAWCSAGCSERRRRQMHCQHPSCTHLMPLGQALPWESLE